MATQQIFQGHWNEVSGKIRSKWGQLTNDDLAQFNGNVDQLVGLIQRKTGEAKERVEHFIHELGDGSEGTFTKATEAAKEYTQQAAAVVSEKSKQAADAVRQGYDQASESVMHGYEEAEKMVKDRPVESMLVVFGTGLLVGVCIGLVSRGR